MSFSGFDHQCMARALSLAARGLFTTDPNPRVGCVLATDGRIVGEGWHRVAGGPHAEIEALAGAGPLARGATAYVTLEPCSHHGRTPPCTEALIGAGVQRVVFAAEDPNPLVNGGGRQRLQAAGIAVDSGLMAPESETLNPGFFKRMRQGSPWVRVKTAVSLDGRTALANGESMWISGEASRRDVQRWRARSSAIMTGIGTVLADDPNMTVRDENVERQPLRVVVDSRWKTPPDSRILATPEEVLIAGSEDQEIPRNLSGTGVACVALPCDEEGVSLHALLAELARRETNEIQVEAGAKLCGALLRNGLVDEILLYQAPLLLGDGGAGPFALGPLESMRDRTHLRVMETVSIGRDTRIRLAPTQERS